MKRKLKRMLGRVPFLQGYREKYVNFDEVFGVAAACVLCGFIIGGVVAFASFGEVSRGNGGVDPLTQAKNWWKSTFNPIVSVPGLQADGSFVFSDFETVSDFKLWTSSSSQIELSQKHAHAGDHSIRIKFYGNTRMAGISIEDYFSSRYGLSDWSDYKSLRFYLYNPRPGPERVILQIEDTGRKRYKTDLQMQGESGRDFEIPLDEVSKALDIRRIDEITFFLWEPGSDREFYLDALRLEA